MLKSLHAGAGLKRYERANTLTRVGQGGSTVARALVEVSHVVCILCTYSAVCGDSPPSPKLGVKTDEHGHKMGLMIESISDIGL